MNYTARHDTEMHDLPTRSASCRHRTSARSNADSGRRSPAEQAAIRASAMRQAWKMLVLPARGGFALLHLPYRGQQHYQRRSSALRAEHLTNTIRNEPMTAVVAGDSSLSAFV